MKKFLVKFLCFLLLLAIPFGIVGCWYHALSPISDELRIPLKDMPETIDLAVIGSSHALYGVDLSAYSENYFNFSLAGQTPRYDLQMLKEFEDRMAEGATVIMTVSYMSPFWTEPESQFLEKQTRYYRLLSPENILHYDAKEAFRVKLTQYIPASRIFFTDASTVLQTIAKSFHKAQEPSHASPGTPWYENIDHQTEVLEKKHMELIEPWFPEMNPDVAQAYEGIFALAEKHDWNLIAVTTPFTDVYNDIFDDDFYEVFYGHVDRMLSAHDVPYWDYSRDPQFTHELDLFSDLDHLSAEGSRRFSQILADRLSLGK